MIPKECKPLREVGFPIAEVSKHSAGAKPYRHGHPSRLHLWWAGCCPQSTRTLIDCGFVLEERTHGHEGADRGYDLFRARAQDIFLRQVSERMIKTFWDGK